MNSKLESYRLMMMGQKNAKTELTQKEKEQITKAYSDLVLGIISTKWAQKGKTLGQAWYDSLNEMEAFVKDKEASNPANLYLKQLFSSHKVKWQQLMMTDKNKDEMLDCSAEELGALSKYGQQEIAKNKAILDGIIAKHAEAETGDKKKAFEKSKEQLIKMYMMQVIQKQRQKTN